MVSKYFFSPLGKLLLFWYKLNFWFWSVTSMFVNDIKKTKLWFICRYLKLYIICKWINHMTNNLVLFGNNLKNRSPTWDITGSYLQHPKNNWKITKFLLASSTIEFIRIYTFKKQNLLWKNKILCEATVANNLISKIHRSKS